MEPTQDHLGKLRSREVLLQDVLRLLHRQVVTETVLEALGIASVYELHTCDAKVTHVERQFIYNAERRQSSGLRDSPTVGGILKDLCRKAR